MKTHGIRKSKKVVGALPKGVARDLRLVRPLLLAGTVIAGAAGMALAMSPGVALAASGCTEQGPDLPSNIFSCNGGVYVDPETISPTAGFDVYIDGDGVNAYELDVNDGGPAFTVNADYWSGTIRQGEDSSIANANGDGMLITNPSELTFGVVDEVWQPVNAVVLNVDGEIVGGYAQNAGEGGNGVSVFQIGTEDGYSQDSDMWINVGASGNIEGASSGIFSGPWEIEDGDAYIEDFYVENEGSIVGRGNSGISLDIVGEAVVYNLGHIQGWADGGVEDWGAGIYVTGASGVWLENHSYGTVMGADGELVENVYGPVAILNSEGLIAGLAGDGVHVDGVDNLNDDWDAVFITNSDADDDEYNGGGGIIIGSQNGITVRNVASEYENANVTINNEAWYDSEGAGLVQGGLILGYSEDGVNADNIEGTLTVRNAGTLLQPISFADLDPEVYGEDGLIDWYLPDDLFPSRGIFGFENGINATYVAGGVFVANGAESYGYYDSESEDYVEDYIGGGLIHGEIGDGIHVAYTEDGVGLYNAAGLVIGGDDGLSVNNVSDGGVWVGNSAFQWFDGQDSVYTPGVIIGLDDDGVDLRNIAGDYRNYHHETEDYVEHEFWYVAAEIENAGSIIWGNDDGISARNLYGDVYVDNYYGLILGGDRAISVRNVTGGDVYVYNAYGRIEGFYGDAINIRGVYSEEALDYYEDDYYSATLGGHVQIENGNGYDSQSGGLILGADRAIRVSAETVAIYNDLGGMILGDGSYSQPVIELRTSTDALSYDGSNAFIWNGGLIASTNLPGFDHGGWDLPDLDVTEDPFDRSQYTTTEFPFSAEALEKFYEDQADIVTYAWSGGAQGSAGNLSDYADAADDVIVKTTSGALTFVNEGVMVGRLRLDGWNDTYTEDGNDYISNTVVNFGVWLTHDSDGGYGYGNRLSGGEYDQIENAGLIQTAFGADTYEYATFDRVNAFHNGSYWSWNSQTEEYGFAYTGGLVSLLDGGTGDYVWIDNDFHGSKDGYLTSFIGLDVNFAGTDEDYDEDWYYPETWRSDYFDIQEGIYGSTGLIINKVGDGLSGEVGDKIYVGWAKWDKNDSDQHCYETACVEGDTVYISDMSEGYITVDGVGAIQNGLYAWYLFEEGYVPDPDFVLVSEWGPQAVQLGGVITGAQNIWYDTSEQVADHIYGGYFAKKGGGAGADLPVGIAPPADAPNSALWAKLTGSLTEQDTSVVQTIGGGPATLNIDTGFSQRTFSLLAGADFHPSADLRLGVFGGYLSSNLEFNSYGAAAKYQGGAIGAYAAYTQGSFYIDGEFKADFLDVNYTAPIGSGLDITTSSTTLGILANTGYRMDMGNMFFEPIASAAIVNTDIDNVAAGGGTVEFSNGTSIRAAVGAKVGTTLGTPGDTVTEIAVLGKVWNEFEDANTVTLTDTLGNSTTYGDSISGLFGELRAIATVTNADTDFSAFGSVGVKFGENFNTVDGKIGLRKGF